MSEPGRFTSTGGSAREVVRLNLNLKLTVPEAAPGCLDLKFGRAANLTRPDPQGRLCQMGAGCDHARWSP
jgi:hypothetical protein